MLAPRKTLWSTPNAVIDRVIENVSNLGSRDRICDIGCGDGRVILRWAAALSESSQASLDNSCQCDFPSFIGIDIDSDRVNQAKFMLEEARKACRIDRRIDVSFHCTNVLESEQLIQDATVFFLYLIPRGLRKIKPILNKLLEDASEEKLDRLRVITYMSPLPDEAPVRVERVQVPHQPDAIWPVYFYSLAKED